MSLNGRGGRVATEGGFLGPLRAVAMIAAMAGAGGSAGLTLHVGRHNASRILLVLFVTWVLSPFAALVFANVVSKRWPVLIRTMVYSVMLILTLGSLAIYGEVAFGTARAKPAFAFLVVPLASWLLIAIVFPVTAFLSGRLAQR
jgi:hypothetical protein